MRKEPGDMSALEIARQQFQQERKKAIERMRTIPDGVVGWVIRLLQTDLEALTPTEWTLVAFEIAGFVDTVTDQYGGIVATESGWAVQGFPHGTVHDTIPSRKEGIGIQDMALRQLEEFWKEGRAVFEFPQLTMIVTQPGAFNEDTGTVVVAAKRKAKEFEYRFAHLLAQSGRYIQRCPECSKIYLAIRCDQVYCHPRCQNRVASRKWRENRKADRKTDRTSDRRKENRRGTKSGKG